MAKLLLQVARIDQAGLKTAISKLPATKQQNVQKLLRDEISSSTTAPASTSPSGGGAGFSAAPKARIELKLKF